MAARTPESFAGTIRKCKRKRAQTPPPALLEEEDVEEKEEEEEGRSQKKVQTTCGVWKNLDLALSFQTKDIGPQSKVGLAFDFVSLEGGNIGNRRAEPLQISNLASFLGGQVQSILTSKGSDGWDPCLDARCWVILRFCLEKSYFRVAAKFLGSVNRVLSHALSQLDSKSALHAESAGLYENVLECLSLLFSCHGRVINNAHMNLWVLCASAAINLNGRILSHDRCELSSPNVLLHLSCLVLEQFASFLKVHPNPKQMFLFLVDSLLESLLESVVMLHQRIRNGGYEFERKLLGVLDDILSNGLFHSHPAHMSGFFSLKGSHSMQEGYEFQRFKGGYQRNLFEKVKRMITMKEKMSMTSVGDLFRLFVRKAKKKKEGIYSDHKKDYTSQKSLYTSDKHSKVSAEVQETSRPMFEVFMLFLEPLLDIRKLGEMGESDLTEVHHRLESINQIVAILMHEKIYVPVEDITMGANYRFLKEAYDTICCICEKVYQLPLSTLNVAATGYENIVVLVIKELIISLGYFLEIEYKVVGDDLVPIWLMILSSLAISMSMDETNQGGLVMSGIFRLGGQMIKLFTDLRQVVGSPNFALFKAVRFFLSGKHGELDYSLFLSCRSLSSQMRSKAVATLLLSQELRTATCNALKSIPEGQASTYIKQLNLEIIESLKWIRIVVPGIDGHGLHEGGVLNNVILDFNSQAEVIGILSEPYTVLLNAVSVTTGNSNSVGKAIKDLVDTLRPSFTSLIISKWGSVDEFICSIMGRRFSNHGMPELGTVFLTPNLDASWIFVFLFRMYISCRSLYRQAISLMPQDARKAAVAMGSLFTVCHGENWIGKTEFRNRNYFSWVVAQSTSLPAVIRIIGSLFPNNKIDHAPLVYVLHAVALQRLTDLNRQIKGFDFLYEREEKSVQNHSSDGAADSRKIKKEKWKQVIDVLKQEALELTSFMTDYLPLKKLSHWSKMCTNNDTWDFCACSLNEKSLPVAIWWLLCQNIDVWCGYTTSKILMKVLSLVIYSASQNMHSKFKDTRGMGEEVSSSSEVTINQISSELLMDTVFYEQKNISRHLTSGFLLSFKKSLSPLLSHAGVMNVDLEVLPDWAEVENTLGNRPLVGKNAGHGPLSIGPDVLLSTTCHLEDCSAREAFGMKICQNLLNLLCRVIKVHTNASSVLLLTTYVLNLERFAVSTLMKCYEEPLLFNHFELLSLFVSCRRALRYMASASFDEGLTDKQSPCMQLLNGNIFSVSWLLKSVAAIVALPCTFFEKESCAQTKEMFFILMDHTSYLFLLVTKGLLSGAMPSLVKGQVHHAEIFCSGIDEQDKDSFVDSDSAEHVDSWKQLECVASKLKEETENLQIIHEGHVHDVKLEANGNAASCYRISSAISCFQGFLWGLEFALSMSKKSTGGTQDFTLSTISKFYSYINMLEGFVNFCLSLLLVDSESFCKLELGHEYGSNLRIRDDALHSYSSDLSKMSSGRQYERGEKDQTDCSISYLDDNSEKSLSASCVKSPSIKKEKPLAVASTKNNFSAFHLLDLSKLQDLNGTLLHKLLNGENPGIAFLIRQLFISSAAILKLKNILPFPVALSSQIDCTSQEVSSTTILLRAASFFLLEMSENSGIPDSFSYVWLDGVLTYLKEVSHRISHSDPVLSRNVYAKLVDVHLRAIGKCISLQGRAATLASHEMGSNTKLLHSVRESCENNLLSPDNQVYSLNEFKARLRMSFRKLTRRPLKLHFVSAVQALERALVGVQQDCSILYDISTGNVDGGRVSATVAAGVDCFDLVLELVSGKKQLDVIKRHIQNFTSALFNVILHLQNPVIFYKVQLLDSISKVNPDPGAVILMCVEVLTKVARKNDMFQMDSCFRHAIALHSATLDKQFSVDVYAACCKLLCTTLRHHKRESGRCIALLEDSVNALLVCLEAVNAKFTSKEDFFAWSTQEAVTCATFLRRVYEEMRQQKDLLGRYSSHFLSTYISVSSRLGPLKSGIKREIEEALEPGIYALMDMCQPSDLQEVHTVLGEGPCRKKLADLQRDYKLKFQYEGKI